MKVAEMTGNDVVKYLFPKKGDFEIREAEIVAYNDRFSQDWKIAQLDLLCDNKLVTVQINKAVKEFNRYVLLISSSEIEHLNVSYKLVSFKELAFNESALDLIKHMQLDDINKLTMADYLYLVHTNNYNPKTEDNCQHYITEITIFKGLDDIVGGIYKDSGVAYSDFFGIVDETKANKNDFYYVFVDFKDTVKLFTCPECFSKLNVNYITEENIRKVDRVLEGLNYETEEITVPCPVCKKLMKIDTSISNRLHELAEKKV